LTKTDGLTFVRTDGLTVTSRPVNYRSLLTIVSSLIIMEIITITLDELNDLYNEYNETNLPEYDTDEDYLVNLQQDDFYKYST